MKIQSTPSGNSSSCSSQAQSGLAAAAQTSAPSRPDARPSAPPSPELKIPADRIELSAAARELASRLGVDAATPPGLSAARIRELSDRMRGGYYSQAATVDRIVGAVIAEFARDDARA